MGYMCNATFWVVQEYVYLFYNMYNQGVMKYFPVFHAKNIQPSGAFSVWFIQQEL